MKTRIYRPTPHNLRLLAKQLQRGDLVAIPTETVYGLAANALNEVACQAIFTAKDRPTSDPLIVHVRTKSEAKQLTEWNDLAENLAQLFWPGPLTLILPKKDCIPDIVTSGRPSVAIRIPSHPIARKLLQWCGCPLAAPSANQFSYISPTTAKHVKDSLNGKIGAILDGGPTQIGLESTILDIRDPAKPILLRPGGLSRHQLEKVIKVPLLATTVNKNDEAPLAPGQLEKHYSPRTPLILHQQIPENMNPAFAYVEFKKACKPSPRNKFHLTENGDGAEAARSLFNLLRLLDRQPWGEIHMELPPPESEWAQALLDRMSRAAKR